MKNLSLKFITPFILALSTSAFAVEKSSLEAPLEQCAELVKDCFVESIVEQPNCLFSSAKHPFCEGTSLGDLVLKRWSLSPEKSNILEAPPALLGPQIIDKKCLKNFDTKFFDILLREDLSENSISKTDAALESCRKDLSNELTRP
ncbi:MAG: hypothetical protein KDD56_08010 [Bdellovibrionales bacterium]|nr:hypothetical protein [Bdellovibrionales bacterium]